MNNTLDLEAAELRRLRYFASSRNVAPTIGVRVRIGKPAGRSAGSRNLARFAAIVMAILMLPTDSWAQTDSWKIFLRAASTWSALGGVEIDSTGILVTHEGEVERMPRCASLAPDVLDFLSKRVAEAKRYGDDRKRNWNTTAKDFGMAELTIIWPESDKFLRVRMPLPAQIIAGSPPPQFLVELVHESWRLRESAEAPCRS